METISINGRIFKICRIPSKNRNAIAKLKDDTIVISIPSRWSKKDKEEIGSNLEKRAIKAIANGSWKIEANRKIEFSHGQSITAMGRDYEIEFSAAKRFGCKIIDNKIQVKVVENHPQIRKKATGIILKKIVENLKPAIAERIKAFNDAYFRAEISGVKIRNATSIWGSCSTRGIICLNFRLLLLPTEILDYVIVHELAHTKYKSHGKRFWGLVERIIPDHKERRKWLRENGWSTTPQKRDGQQTITDFFYGGMNDEISMK